MTIIKKTNISDKECIKPTDFNRLLICISKLTDFMLLILGYLIKFT